MGGGVGGIASSLTGDVTVIGTVAQTNPTGVLTQIEMPQILANLGANGVTSINGIVASTLENAGAAAIPTIFNQFSNSVAAGGIFTSSGGIAVAQETVEGLGLNGAGVATSADLVSQGLAKVAATGLTVNASGDTFDQGGNVYADPDDDDPSFFLIMIRRVSRPCHLSR